MSAPERATPEPPPRWDRGSLLTLCLLGLSVICVVWSLAGAVRGLDLILLGEMALVGVGCGWLMARSRLPWSIALGLAVVLALGTVFLRVTGLVAQLLALLPLLGTSLWNAQYGRFDPNALTPLNTLAQSVVTLGARLTVWAGGVAAGSSAYDPVVTAFVWGVAVWLLGAWAAWLVRRNARPFTALSPLLVLMGAVLAYTGKDVTGMVLLMGAALALWVLVPHRARESRWARQDIPAAQILGTDLALVAVPVILGLMLLLLITPAFSPRAVTRWMQSFTETRANAPNPLTDSLGLAPAPRPPSVFDTVRAPGLPRSHLLGASIELLDKVALVVQPQDNVDPLAANYYWLGSTYDYYTGRGWLTTALGMQDYDANQAVPASVNAAYRTVRQRVTAASETGLVYRAGELVSVDRAFQTAERADGDLFAATVDSNQYTVESRVPTITPDALRTAQGTVPEWVLKRYLALPESVPPRVLALARDLTATAPTPYDRARAIEDYLHTIPYSLDLPEPPVGRDVVDYFLFDLRYGYCDYYATAMAVLARAAGLPARIAVGYTTGTYSPSSRQYIVTEAQAHSWTQIYFPEYGWVDFEPTTGRASLAAEGGSVTPFATPEAFDSATTAAPLPPSLASVNGWWLLPLLVLGLAAAVAAVVFADGWRLARTPASQVAGLLYPRVLRAAERLGLPVTPSITPDQLVALLRSYAPIGDDASNVNVGWARVVDASELIADAYVRTTYGGMELDAAQAAALVRAWRGVRLKVWEAVIRHNVDDNLSRFLSGLTERAQLRR